MAASSDSTLRLTCPVVGVVGGQGVHRPCEQSQQWRAVWLLRMPGCTTERQPAASRQRQHLAAGPLQVELAWMFCSCSPCMKSEYLTPYCRVPAVMRVIHSRRISRFLALRSRKAYCSQEWVVGCRFHPRPSESVAGCLLHSSALPQLPPASAACMYACQDPSCGTPLACRPFSTRSRAMRMQFLARPRKPLASRKILSLFMAVAAAAARFCCCWQLLLVVNAAVTGWRGTPAGQAGARAEAGAWAVADEQHPSRLASNSVHCYIIIANNRDKAGGVSS